MLEPISQGPVESSPPQKMQSQEGWWETISTLFSTKPLKYGEYPKMRELLGPLITYHRFYKALLSSLEENPEALGKLEKAAEARIRFDNGVAKRGEWEEAKKQLRTVVAALDIPKLEGLKDLIDSKGLAAKLVERETRVSIEDLRDSRRGSNLLKAYIFSSSDDLVVSPFEKALFDRGYTCPFNYPFWYKVQRQENGNYLLGIALPPDRVLELEAVEGSEQRVMKQLIDALENRESVIPNQAGKIKELILKGRGGYFARVKKEFPSIPLSLPQFEKLTSSFKGFESLQRVISRTLLEKRALTLYKAAGVPFAPSSQMGLILSSYALMYKNDLIRKGEAAALVTYFRTLLTYKESAPSHVGALRTREWMPRGVSDYWMLSAQEEAPVVEINGVQLTKQFVRDIIGTDYLIDQQVVKDVTSFVGTLFKKGYSKEEINAISHILNQTAFGTYMSLLQANVATLEHFILGDKRAIYHVTKKGDQLILTAEVHLTRANSFDPTKQAPWGVWRLTFLPDPSVFTKGAILVETFDPKE